MRDKTVKRQGILRILSNNFRIVAKVARLTPDYFISVIVEGIIWGTINSAMSVFTVYLFDALDEGAPFRQSLLDAGVEVNNALTLWQTAKKRVELDKRQVLNLQAAVWNTQLLMKHGNAEYLEVLTAQKNLLQAELTEVSDKFDAIKSTINLYQALGGGY